MQNLAILGRMRYLLSCIFLWLSSLPIAAIAAGDSLHVVILGDSNTWLGGDGCDKPQGWNKWFRDAFQPASCRSFARSGATWTNTPQTRRNTQENIGVLGNDNVIYNQICRLEEAINNGSQPRPQLILILAGTNDAWFQKARPKALSMTTDEAFSSNSQAFRKLTVCEIVTLAESVRYGCELLMTLCPKAQIVLLTPFQSVQAGNTIFKVSDLIAQCGHRMGLNVIRLDHQSGIYAAQEKNRHHLTTDGTHTSEQGAKRVGTFVARQLATLLQY